MENISKKTFQDFLINNAVFWNPMEHLRNHRDIKLVTGNCLVSEPKFTQQKFSMRIYYE